METTLLTAALSASAFLFAGSSSAQDKYTIKVAYFGPPQHTMSKWLENWGSRLEKASDGRLSFRFFPSAQLAPAPAHYDLPRTGQAEVSWFLHGGTPGRFPLTDLISLPFMVGSAGIGTKTLNDPELRSRYLDAEHKGVKVLLLFSSTPINLYTTKKAVRTLEDIKGLRIRFASPSTRDFIAILGGTPVGVQPTEQLDQLQKGGLDGVLTDYGGAGIAFRMAGTVKYATEIYCCATTFGLAMNPEFYQRLPADLKTLVDTSMQGVEAEVGEVFDSLDPVGKNLLLKGGAEAIRMAPDQAAALRKAAERVHEATLSELSSRNLPARDVYAAMRAAAKRHSATSKTFWN